MKILVFIMFTMLFAFGGCESGLTNDTNVNSEGHTEIDVDDSYVYYNEDNSTQITQYTYIQYIYTNDVGGVETNLVEEE